MKNKLNDCLVISRIRRKFTQKTGIQFQPDNLDYQEYSLFLEGILTKNIDNTLKKEFDGVKKKMSQVIKILEGI